MNKVIFLVLFTVFTVSTSGQVYRLQSPDKTVEVVIKTDSLLTYSVVKNGEEIIEPSRLGLLSNQSELTDFLKVEKVEKSEIQVDYDLYWGINDKMESRGNLLTLIFSEKLALEFCAFNEGVAWRYKTNFSENIIVYNELAEYKLNSKTVVYFPDAEGFSTPFEANFLPNKVEQVQKKKFGLTPLLAKTENGNCMVISEANLADYPGMFVELGNKGLKATFPCYPKKEKEQLPGRWRLTNIPQLSKLLVKKTYDYIAKTPGTHIFPWRTIQIAENEKGLLNNQLVAYLADKPVSTQDFSWVKNGKVVWDWYHHNNLEGVDFKSGINTSTYKYMIDFAANNNLQYVNIDDGWCGLHNFRKLNKSLDLTEIIKYAQDKGVGIFLWCTWQTLNEDLTGNLDYFKNLGVSGIKVDFFDRCDQVVVDFVNELASQAASRKLLLNLHGMYKPTGLQVTWPNVVNFEGILGLEYNKFSDKCTPVHNLTIPFIRNVVGPMDYTPGSMRYVSAENFSKSWKNPHTISTRAQQLAMYVIYHGGIQMLADSPTLFEKDSISMEFLSEVPVTWDETIPLYGELGKVVVLARRSGDDWYVAAMTADNSWDKEIDLDFLGEGNYRANIFSNGEKPEQVILKKEECNSQKKLKISVCKLGGYVAYIQLINVGQ